MPNCLSSLIYNKTTRDFVSYAIISGLQKSIPFLLLPFFARFFSKEELGLYVLFQTILLLFSHLASLGVDSAIGINYYHLKGKNFARYFTNGVLFMATLSVLVNLFVVLYKERLGNLLSFPSFWLCLIPLSIFPQIVFNLRQQLHRYENKVFQYGYYALGLVVLINGFGFIFLYFSDLTWQSFLLGNLFGYSFWAVVSLYSFYKEQLFMWVYSKKDLLDSFKVGFPVALHAISSWFLDSYNKIIINTLIGIEATASYGIGATFGLIMTFLQDSLNLVYAPYIYNHLSHKNDTTIQKLRKMGTYMYAVIGLSGIGISFFGYFCLGFIFGDNYLSTQSFIVPLVLCSMLNGFTKIHVAYLFYYKKTLWIAVVSMLSGCLNIVLSYIGVLRWGIIGAAYSLLLVQAFIYIAMFFISNKLEPVDWRKAWCIVSSKKRRDD